MKRGASKLSQSDNFDEMHFTFNDLHMDTGGKQRQEQVVEIPINHAYLADEAETVRGLLALARTGRGRSREIQSLAAGLVRTVRVERKQSSGLHAFLDHYDLSSAEGIVLMCLAESLLRIPDSDTMDDLIADKLSAGNWERHLGTSDSLFVNASTWALMLTGKVIEPDKTGLNNPKPLLTKLLARMEEPMLRAAMKNAMRIMAHQFVMGRTIKQALERSQSKSNHCYRYSYDMLGEAALTQADAERYQGAYADAITAHGNDGIGSDNDNDHDNAEALIERPGISIKLSALCPRFEYTHRQRALQELSGRLLALACLAQQAGIGLTIDAEEADRLELSLAVFAQVYLASELKDWDGIGLALQAYQKRALPVLKWLNQLSTHADKVIPIRLVKGAYWDTEIKRAQELGLKEYPVFTRKSNTDVSYLACARYLLEECPRLYPQFATHNAHTLAYIYHHGAGREYEFQRLHGMGEELYAQVIGKQGLNIPCRVYAPVGAHEDLLPYLIRRLLENGANTSFVNQIVQEDTDIETIIADPINATDDLGAQIRHPRIPLPAQLFGGERINSAGINFADANELAPLLQSINSAREKKRSATAVINGKAVPGIKHAVTNPTTGPTTGPTPGKEISHIDFVQREAIIQAIDAASAAWPDWDLTAADQRARILERAADLYERNRAELMALCIDEAGKTLRDAHSEVREAIDFLRYYAAQSRKFFASPLTLPGPTGESNELRLQGRGVFLAISPWNFPVAIYTGQIAAALAAGNCVLAKPAEQTSLTAHYATQLLYEAGVPPSVLHFVPGDGAQVGRTALSDPRVAGVVFTGSTETARRINQSLAQRQGPIATLIAETGGQNAMIADSTALPEQLVHDVVLSAFNSAGQRCSALRVLYLQEEIAARVLTLLKGYMDELVIGAPMDIATDIGPVIDATAQQALAVHIQSFEQRGKILHRCKIPDAYSNGHFVAPVLIEIENINQLKKEHFGPVLHIVRYAAKELNKVIDEINTCGYGLTLGIHSRIEHRAEQIRRRARVGNIYVNRNMIGAVVGVQPFGGHGLSGTGPKAGGPNYLPRFATEQTYTVNTSAIGGNASLLTGFTEKGME